MGMLDVITRVLRLDEGVKQIVIDDSVTPDYIVDSELSTVSTNPVQNKVITNALNNKIDKSPYIRKIYIGSEQTPDISLGDEGDIYIYLPTQ